jgi:hypothetical protein
MPPRLFPVARVKSGAEGFSTFITSAPMSASNIAVKGPEITLDTSSTRRPASGAALIVFS